MKKIVDGNTAAAMVAYKLSEVIPMYPITPSSPMAEYCDGEAASGHKNLFGQVPTLIEMQSEAGAAGAMHGSLCSGAMTTTFTSSQGLLLMIPNIYKIAGEALPCVFHVAARAVATHALSIFGDHSDVMAVRQTGAILLCSSSVQEAHDFALIAHVLAYKTSLPVIHFFDGFRTSHEIQKIEVLPDEIIEKMLPISEIENFKKSSLNPSHPYQKGTAQNPDVFFQNREACESSYRAVPQILEKIFDQFFALTGRRYHNFDLTNANAKNVVVSMGSSCETLQETCPEDSTVMKVRLYRPFDYAYFEKIMPKSAKVVNVLDRTKECGSREPLFLDVKNALSGRKNLKILGGRYGLGGKEFSPENALSVFKNTEKDNFTVGIVDDVTSSNLENCHFKSNTDAFSMKFWGLGSDGTVSASKSTIKILGENLDKFVQGYFEYDSKKSGSLTRSHVRVSDHPIHGAYLVTEADIITINNFSFVHKYDILSELKISGKVLINTIFSADEVDKVLPDSYKVALKQKQAQLFVINAQKLAQEVGLGNKINIIMQSAMFKVAQIIPQKDASSEIEKYIKSTFSKKGKAVVEKNIKAARLATERIEEVKISSLKPHKILMKERTPSSKFEKEVMLPIEKLQGDKIPVSALEKTGKVPQGTAELEKRAFAAHLPRWIPANCVQCGQCVMACPHNAIRAILTKAQTPEEVEFAKAFGIDGCFYRIQISPEDCTGCGVCANTCIAKNKALVMEMAEESLEVEKKNYAICQTLKREKNTTFSTDNPKGLQFEDSYFAFSGACGGCGETPYIRLATTLFGKNMIIANATGCSSIYGGSFPSCPYLKDENGNGPAWANSLFEDNAEFGLGIKVGSKYNHMQTSTRGETSVWIIGGDGWAYDIGYGGLDHVLSSRENVNILVLDSEVYSNTGGQASKSTPRGAMVKFANAGKPTKKKDLVALAIASNNAYVAQVSLGANMSQCIKAFKEAESFNGPSIIVAYAPCTNHGIDMSQTNLEMKRAVESGYWTLLRYSPEKGLQIDSTADFEKYDNFVMSERRFSVIADLRGEEGKKLLEKSKIDAKNRLAFLQKLTKNM